MRYVFTKTLFGLFFTMSLIGLGDYFFSAEAYTRLTGVVLLMGGQVIFGVAYLTVLNKHVYMQDIRMAFLGVAALAIVWFPLVNVLGLQVSPHWHIPYTDHDLLMVSEMGLLGLIGVNAGFLLRPVRWQDSGMHLQIIRRRRNYWPPLIFVGVSVIALGIYAFWWSQELGFSIFSVMVGRGLPISRGLAFSGFGSWWFYTIQLVIGAYVYFLLRYSQLTKLSKRFFVFIFLFLIVQIVAIGNRREVAPFILGFFVIWAAKHNYHLSIRMTIIIFIIFTGLLLVQSLRVGDPLDWVLTFNDFTATYISPIFLVRYIDVDWLMGSTYLHPVFLLFPRAIFPWKPEPIANEIGNLVQSFGFSGNGALAGPQTESYINFGFWGLFLIMLVFSLFFSWLVKNNHRYPWLYIALYVSVFDIFRSSFLNFFAAILLILIGYSTCVFVASFLVVSRNYLSLERSTRV